MRLTPTATISPPDLKDFFLRCFEDYTVPVHFDRAQFVERLRVDGVDLEASRILEENGVSVGVMLVSRRGSASRLAAMGLVKTARGQGLGKKAMRLLLDEARARGDREMVLEVIEQNPAAVALYRSVGFQAKRRLLGFRTGPVERSSGAELETVDLRRFNAQLAAHAGLDLPWQLSWESFANLGSPYVAFRRGPAWALTTDPDAPPVILRSLVVESEARRQGHGRALLDALVRHHGGEWRVSGVIPEELAGLFRGWEPDPISQFEMVLPLESA